MNFLLPFDSLSFSSFSQLIVIDCLKQNESLKYVPVDIRLEFETSQPFPTNTTAYCLIIHNRMVQYKSISGEVRKLV